MGKIIPPELSTNLMGHLLYWIFPLRKKIIKKNIDIVFGQNASCQEKRKLAIAYYSHVFTFIKEMLLEGLGIKPPQIKIIGTENLMLAANQEKGVLLLTGHVGNWEIGVHVLPQKFQHICPQFFVTRKALKIKRLEKILYKRCQRSGLGIIYKKGALKKINTALAQKSAIVFVLDQHMSTQKKSGIAVDFFGTTAGTHTSLAVIAYKKQAPVVPLACYRQKDGTHIVEFYPPLTWKNCSSYEQSIYENTLIYNQVVETIILKNPTQWWWAHRRWKLANTY